MTKIFKYVGSLGEIHGVQGDDVIQFSGVKYASLANRFAKSELLGHNVGNSCDMEFSIIQHSLPKPEFSISELGGLHLNITVPLVDNEMPRPETKLPVFVFIHGGAFAMGSNAWPQYSQARLVKLSAELGKPVIGVGINYRLGVLGFLTSAELRAEGYESNNGLRDQMTALRWIKKNIGGFGGDGENVTVIGESAGSVSGMHLLHSPEPLFKRLVGMSGSPLMLPPLSPPVTEFAYAAVIQALELSHLSSAGRVEALLKVPIKTLLEKIPPMVPLMPVIDGTLIPGLSTFAQISSEAIESAFPLPGKLWCEALMVGDCQLDATIITPMLEPRLTNIGGFFTSSLTSYLTSSQAAKILSAYSITPSTPDAPALRAILRFATDIGFLAPTISLANGWPGAAYVYHFNEPNPWDGPWKGEASHILDVAFLFQNFSEFLEEEQKESARTFAADFIHFVNGKAPWQEWAPGKGAKVYGPSVADEGVKCQWIAYADDRPTVESGRESTILQLAEEIPLDEMAAAWGAFLQLR
ncbi:hypothetical protein VE02_07942 [Pseudogymnoascus sp. 03VT05]|nr:hypothetical protein VE02_07942 [Pseudogymnoascus sp. 03VT05]